MLPGQVRLGCIFGIEIGLHFSWFIIAALLTMSLAGHLYAVNPAWPRGLIWTAAGLTALAFFAAIVLHELSHAAVARARGVPVPSITLFALGGIAQMKRDTADAATEFWMGLGRTVREHRDRCRRTGPRQRARLELQCNAGHAGHGHAGVVWLHQHHARWDATPAGEAMKPVERLHRIDASEPVTKAFDAIVQEDVNQLPVVEQGQIRGVISRDQLLRLVAARAELTM
jgi:hypothetical protein